MKQNELPKAATMGFDKETDGNTTAHCGKCDWTMTGKDLEVKSATIDHTADKCQKIRAEKLREIIKNSGVEEVSIVEEDKHIKDIALSDEEYKMQAMSPILCSVVSGYPKTAGTAWEPKTITMNVMSCGKHIKSEDTKTHECL